MNIWICLMFPTVMAFAIQDPRPFYLFGHMMNSLDEVDSALADGANAIETDVEFGLTGRPLRIYHGLPCDCFRDCLRSEHLPRYLSYVSHFGIPGHHRYNPKMTLLYLDLKLEEVLSTYYYIAGHRFGEILLAHFFQGGTITTFVKIIIGLQSVKQRSFLLGFLKVFLPYHYFLLGNIGYDISGTDSFLLIHNLLAQLRLENHSWQGDGITNCLPRSDYRLREAVWQRDTGNYHINKVYAWTVDNRDNMRNALRLNVDGIMTNKVSTLKKILRESEFRKKYRLATNEDNPWIRIIGHGPFRHGCEQNTCWKDCDINGDWCWTSVTGCGLYPQRCNHTLPCSGSCGKRIHYLQAIGKALLHSFGGKAK